jgi:hypothetical protein
MVETAEVVEVAEVDKAYLKKHRQYRSLGTASVLVCTLAMSGSTTPRLASGELKPL